ncbi:serine/threonine-protein kinase pim-1-like [Argopecten irradians]|uniref:serine/threonine-protein kinase pim-1-like n=1 Tax=Argopecten irradians TaxID=31199 RepID=UPI003718AACC
MCYRCPRSTNASAVNCVTDYSSADGSRVEDIHFKRMPMYTINKHLGSGGFGSVYSGTRKGDNFPVAIKIISKNKVIAWGQLNGQIVPMEICLLEHVNNCPGVINILDWFELNKSFAVVMERQEHVQDLFDYITEKGALDEESSKKFFRQIVDTVINIHRMGVVHRDIKDENILVDLKTDELKLIDFGSGAFLKDTVYLEFSGTRVCSPPEWIKFHMYHGHSAAVWSLGILLFNLLSGDIPFKLDADILAGKLTYTRDLSNEVKDLVEKCLAICPSDRPTLEEILAHPWLACSHL